MRVGNAARMANLLINFCTLGRVARSGVKPSDRVRRIEAGKNEDGRLCLHPGFVAKRQPARCAMGRYGLAVGSAAFIAQR